MCIPICQFVSCNAKSGSTFWHGRAGRLGSKWASIFLVEGGHPEGGKEGGKLLWALSLLQRPTRASSSGGLNLEMLDHDSIKQYKFFARFVVIG